MGQKWIRTFAFRAIRGAWAVANHAGLAEVMKSNEAVRFAMMAAWKAGYRNGREDEKRRVAATPEVQMQAALRRAMNEGFVSHPPAEGGHVN